MIFSDFKKHGKTGTVASDASLASTGTRGTTVVKSNSKKAILTILSFILIFSNFTSCKKNKKIQSDGETFTITLADGKKEDLVSKPQAWHVTNQRVLVFLGYDFNKTEVYQPMLEKLKERYGLYLDGGLIYPLIYPANFKHETKGYASELYSDIQDSESVFSGIIFLGAPENTHYALADIQDDWNQEVPYPTIALFPQDDILGTEAACDFVLDKGQTAEITGEIFEEETETQLIEEATEILIKTLDYISTLNYSFKRDASLQKHIMTMYQGHKIHHYTDPETGLQSINHFVLE